MFTSKNKNIIKIAIKIGKRLATVTEFFWILMEEFIGTNTTMCSPPGASAGIGFLCYAVALEAPPF
jgi:hypothetical protein